MAHDHAGKANGPLAYVLLLAMGVAWGLALSLAKIAVSAGGHPIGLALWQVVVSSALLLTISAFVRQPPRLTGDLSRFAVICGACGVGFPAIAIFSASAHLPSGIVAIGFASMPMFTYALSVLFGVEDATRRRFSGVGVGLGAMGLIIVPGTALPGPGLVPWVGLVLAASVSMSFENFYAAGLRPKNATSLQLSCARQLGAVGLLTPIALWTQTTVAVFEPWGEVQWAATGTGVLSGLAYTGLMYSIATSGPVFATQCSYVITLAGIAWGIALFDEHHSVWVWLALVATIAGIALVRPTRPRRASLRAFQAPGL